MDTTGLFDMHLLPKICAITNAVIIHVSRIDILELPISQALKPIIQKIKTIDPSIKVVIVVRDTSKSQVLRM